MREMVLTNVRSADEYYTELGSFSSTRLESTAKYPIIDPFLNIGAESSHPLLGVLGYLRRN
jgi:hypothetical protein